MSIRNVTIHRDAERENGFAIINRNLLEDSRLTWPARGVLGYLLVKPTDWIVRVSDVAKRGNLSAGSIYKIFKELRAYGYMRKVSIRDPGGKFKECVWEVYESPYKKIIDSKNDPNNDLAHLDKPKMKEPYGVNEQHTNKTGLLKNSINNNTTTTTGNVILDFDETLVPSCLEKYKNKVVEILTIAKKEHRIEILNQVEREFKKGLRGERAAIKSPFFYLKSLCKSSAEDKYISLDKSTTKIGVDSEYDDINIIKREVASEIEHLKMMIKYSGPEQTQLQDQLREKEKELKNFDQLKSN